MSTTEVDVNAHVLVIEDNPDDVTLMLRALKKHNLGERVHVLRDGAAALDYFFRDGGTPKLIFLDLKLPKVD
ncbi:MAG: response regulator, partial [Acidobacteria bacterium]|nr:response regulator [Acidobacteriota bacterium]